MSEGMRGPGPERTKALFAADRILARGDVERGEDGVYRLVRSSQTKDREGVSK
jgi:hypothetical protein